MRLPGLKMSEMLLILLFIGSFLFVRLYRFSDTFHFYHDQPLFSIKALEIWESKDIPLIGPPISFNLEGRQVFQGGIIYLTQLFFLLIGGFDPKNSTLAFILFSSLMQVPLWLGVKKMGGTKAATLAVATYAFFPPLITGTLELTNPYYQLALTPILIYVLSYYLHRPTWQLAGWLGLVMGILLQFHYQFVLVIAVTMLYLIIRKPYITWGHLGAVLGGGSIGFSPLIIFELRNNFYNLRTMTLYLQHWGKFGQQLGGGGFPIQYFLSIMLIGVSALAVVFAKKLPRLIVLMLVGFMVLWAIRDFVISPTQGGILKDWRYMDELKVNEIVRHENLTNYNIVMWYDTRSITQRYLFKINNAAFDFENYRNNRYLFVVYKNEEWQKDGAYELNTFKPAKKIKEWKINDSYKLYLSERLR